MKTVGDYEYDEKKELGSGAFGVVYKGCNKTTLAEVAIKEVDAKNCKLKFLHDTIARETKILKTLSNPRHKNIVTLLHCEQQDRFVYFVMEFYNGGNLQEYIRNKQKLEESTIRLFLKQIADGLKAAHDMQIIHRDLKPENILLCFSGPKYPSPDNIILKIADFGIGRFLDADEMACTHCGTPLYMAPEILLYRRGGYEYKADLWSSGVIAYECLVGSLPGNSPMALQDVEIPKNISPDFNDLLNGLLEKDESKRFSTELFFNHRFLNSNSSFCAPIFDISVTVSGPSNQHRTVQIKNNAIVDELIDRVCNIFALGRDSENVYLVHDGRTLERGSGNSLIDSDIKHNSTITFGMRVSGGHYSDLDDARTLDDLRMLLHRSKSNTVVT